MTSVATPPNEYDPPVLVGEQYYPQLHPQIEILPETELGFILRDQQSNRSCRISELAQPLIPVLDGEHSVTDLQLLLQNTLGKPVSTQSIKKFIAMLGKQGMLVDEEGVFGPLTRQERRGRAFLRIIHIRIPLVQGRRFLTALAMLVRLLPQTLLQFILAALLINGIVTPTLMIASGMIDLKFAPSTLQTASLAVLIALILAEIIVHELAHGLCLTLLGGKVRDFGVGLHYFLIPYAYTNTTDSYRLKRWGRILVSLAGPMVEVSLLGINAASLYFGLFSPGAAQIVLLWMAFQVTILMWNANPFLPFDGYYILADAFGEPALRREGFRYLRSLPRRLLGKSKDQVSYTRRQRWIYLIYGLMTSIYMIGFIGYGILGFAALMPPHMS